MPVAIIYSMPFPRLQAYAGLAGQKIIRVWLERSLNKNFSQKIILQNTSFAPEGDFNFSYYRTPETPGTSSIHTNYTLNYVTLETRFAYGETFLQNDNERISLGVDRGPEVTLSWSYGNRSIAGGDFDMNRLSVDVEQKLGLGVFGNAKYTVHAANYFSRLPYPALKYTGVINRCCTTAKRLTSCAF
jgi:hypothetical protein